MTFHDRKLAILGSSLLITLSLVLIDSIGPTKTYANVQFTRWYNYCDVDKQAPALSQCDYFASVRDECENETTEESTYYCDGYFVPMNCYLDILWECHGSNPSCGTKRDCATGEIVYGSSGAVICDNVVLYCTSNLMD